MKNSALQAEFESVHVAPVILTLRCDKHFRTADSLTLKLMSFVAERYIGDRVKRQLSL